ncbi:ferric reductase-like transmembrane domain-containing protein [Paenibacillus sp. OV219]|uniref:ferric reductase-like transmembrane domain-containing protein n=1 Tax=Paenibacillus sp. OV219 TaxID=1884377 RepID=UPI0008C2CF49|nr:ferric reductase-like transmembrane domain-containing protein [Paenibacillus sp. OV219]SEO51101.1 Ferric reductase like transmembrane component [Paenibacillus sp. OV219]
MISYIVDLPTWPIIRTLGIASYVMLTLGICLGILYSFPQWSRESKADIYKLHSFLTISGTVVGLLHGVFTVIDTYMPFSWRELLVPFTARNHPVLNGLGILAAYGMLIVILTTDLRNKLKKKLWFLIHLSSYPIFVMAFIHGYFLGTDTQLPVIRLGYIVTAATVLLLTIARAFIRRFSPKKSKAQTASRSRSA